MKLALFDTHGACDGAQRSLLDFAHGLQARQWELVAILGEDGPLGEALRRLGMPVIVEPWPRNLSPSRWHPRAWHYAWRLSRQLRNEGVGLLYANSTAAASLGELATRSWGRVIWRLHQPVDSAITRHRRLCASLWQVQVPSPLMRDTLRLLVGDQARVRVVPHGIVPHPMTASVRKRGEPPVIGMYDAWGPSQGQEVLGRAFRLLQDNGQRAQLRIGGPAVTAESQRFRTMVVSELQAAGVDNRLSLVEPVADIPAFFASCDVVVIPALQDASIRKALEASAAGRPVVATRVSGMADIIEDGHTGLLTPPNNPRALADALALLLASSALRKEMGRQARIRMEERFSLDAMLDAFEAAVRQDAPAGAAEQSERSLL